MNRQTFHKTPLSFWLLIATAILIAELCLIYLSLQAATSQYYQPGHQSSVVQQTASSN